MRKLLIILLVPFLIGSASTDFDGTNDHIIYGDIPALDDATAITCVAWVYNDNVTQDHTIVGSSTFGTPATTDSGFYFFVDDVKGANTNVFHCQAEELNANGDEAYLMASSTNTAVSGAWQRVACMIDLDNDTSFLHIDGGASDIDISDGDAITTLANLGGDGNSWWAGENTTINDDRNGKIAYLQCWNRALTFEETEQALFCPNSITNGLQLYDPMLDGANTHIDLSGNGNNGAVTGATDFSDAPPVSFCGGSS